MPNIEIKAHYPDLAKARAVCARLDARSIGTDVQTDTYFRVPQGRMKLRESSLSGAMLIPYLRPNESGPKKSDYVLLPVSDVEKTKSLLERMFGVDTVVRKSREIHLIGNVRVHLDTVEGLGSFFEFEAVYENPADEESERLKVEKLMREFEIGDADLQTVSYQQLTTGL